MLSEYLCGKEDLRTYLSGAESEIHDTVLPKLQTQIGPTQAEAVESIEWNTSQHWGDDRKAAHKPLEKIL